MKMTKPLRIGLIGHMRSGKNTAAEIIHDELSQQNETPYLLSFAQPLRGMVLAAYGGISREHMQRLGAGIRSVDPDYFTRVFVNTFRDYRSSNVVVTDVRYPNEAMCLLGLGFDLWYINADEVTRAKRSGLSAAEFYTASQHESERIVQHTKGLASRSISNLGDLESFKSSVLDVLADVRNRT